MASQMSFCKILTAITNYRSSFLYRSALTNCSHIATLKTESQENLKLLPEKPRKPPTSFFLFIKERREAVKTSHPNIKSTELTKMLSKEWINLDNSVKKKYETQFRKSMDSYLQKFAEYHSKLTDKQKSILKQIRDEKSEEKKHRQLKKTLKDLNKPKRSKGAYMHFVLEYYEKQKATGVKFKDYLKTASLIWKTLPDSEKQKYNKLYVEDKKRYDLEMEQWEGDMMKTGHTELIRQSTASHNAVPIRTIKRKDDH